MNGIFGTKALSGLGAYGSGLKDDVPPWCASQADWAPCVAKAQEACTDDCVNWTKDPPAPADCIPKCTAAWTQIRCTPPCVAKQPVPITQQSHSILSSKLIGVPVWAWGLIGLTLVTVGVVVAKR